MNNLQPFSDESLPLEKESEKIISKMKTIQKNHEKKKKNSPKNNYKNVEVLENVHDEKPQTLFSKMNDFVDGITELENNLKELNDKLGNVEGFTGEDDDEEGFEDDDEEGFEDDDEEGFEDDDEEGFEDDDEEGFEDDDEEGFEDDDAEGFEDDDEEGFEDDDAEGFEDYNLTKGKHIYVKEYESANGGIKKKSSDHYYKLAMRGKLSKKMIKQLCKSGILSKKQCKNIKKKQNRKKGGKKGSKKKSSGKKGKCNSNRFRKYIDMAVKYVTNLRNYYKFYLKKLANFIYKKTDGVIDGRPNSKNKKDIEIISKQIDYFIAVPSAIFFAYNWYYVIFYKDETNQKIPYTFGETVNSFTNNGILKYLFTALVQPVILLNAFLRKVCPSLVDKWIDTLGYLKFGEYLDFTILKTIAMNPIAQFIALVCIILYYSCKYSDKVFDSLISFMGKGKTPSYMKWIYMIVTYDIIIGVARRKNTFVGNIQSVADRITSIMQTIFSPISSFALWMVFVIFSYLNIRLAGLFMIIYLYATSYFGMGIYNGINNKSDIAQAWSGMNTLFRKSVTDIGGRSCPPNPTFFEKLFVVCMELFYDCMAHMLYFIILIYGIYKYVTELKSNSTRIILCAVNTAILFMIMLYMFIKVRSKMLNPLDVNDYDHI